MPLQLTVEHVSDAGDSVVVRGTGVLSGNYTAGAGNGEVVNFGTAIMAKLAAGMAGIPSSELPIKASFWPRNAGVSIGYNPGATRDAGKIRIFTTANTELTGAPTAYPAYLTGDVIDFEATFRKLI